MALVVALVRQVNPPATGSPSRSQEAAQQLPEMLRKPAPASPLRGASSDGHRGSPGRKGFGRRSLLPFLFASTAAALPEANDSQKTLLQKYLEKSKANKARNDKERLDSYYKRNYRDYFDFVEGGNRGKGDELLSESDKGIRRWLENNR